jgi:RimJ/RimL family protein N-acetyltransferase
MDYQNKGYATEAVKCMLKYAFTELDLLVVAVCHYSSNLKSKRVIEKCGFTYEGTLRKYSRNLTDSVRYSMIKDEWENL